MVKYILAKLISLPMKGAVSSHVLFMYDPPWGLTLTCRAVLIAVGSCIITGYFSMDIVLFTLPAGLPI